MVSTVRVRAKIVEDNTGIKSEVGVKGSWNTDRAKRRRICRESPLRPTKRTLFSKGSWCYAVERMRNEMTPAPCRLASKSGFGQSPKALKRQPEYR